MLYMKLKETVIKMKRFIKSIVDNHCLPDNKVEVSQYTFLELNVES